MGVILKVYHPCILDNYHDALNNSRLGEIYRDYLQKVKSYPEDVAEGFENDAAFEPG